MSFCLAIADADWSLTKDVFEVVGTVFTAIGVVVASYVGIKGLATWSKQIRGQNDHDLARRMLIELYKFEMSFDRFRAPAIYSYEVQLEDDPPFNAGEAERFLRMELGFKRRLDNLNAAYAEISVSLLEAKALWRNQIVEIAHELKILVDEYEEYVHLRLLCADPHEPDDEKLDHKMHLDLRRTVFRNRLGLPDEFGVELQSHIREFERFLRKKLVK